MNLVQYSKATPQTNSFSGVPPDKIERLKRSKGGEGSQATRRACVARSCQQIYGRRRRYDRTLAGAKERSPEKKTRGRCGPGTRTVVIVVVHWWRMQCPVGGYFEYSLSYEVLLFAAPVHNIRILGLLGSSLDSPWLNICVGAIACGYYLCFPTLFHSRPAPWKSPNSDAFSTHVSLTFSYSKDHFHAHCFP